METITFTRMTISDIEAVLAIEQAVFTSPWTEGMFYAELFDRFFSFPCVMTSAEERVGYLIYWEIVDEFHLMNLAVAPKWQRHGMGGMGINWLKERGIEKGIERIILEVRESNHPAQALYRKFGFHPVARRKRYYSAPVEDALLLQYDFPEKPMR